MTFSLEHRQTEAFHDTQELHAIMTRNYKQAINPWESSSEIFTAGAHSLGLSEEFRFEDVLGLAGPLPDGTVALVLVYITPDHYESQKARIASEDESGVATGRQDPNVVFLSQKVQNACGPYALFHAVFNSIARDHIGKLHVRVAPSNCDSNKYSRQTILPSPDSTEPKGSLFS